MLKTVELSLWDIFVYFTTGVLVLVTVLLHLLIMDHDFSSYMILFKIPTAAIVFVFPFLLLLIGLLLEPIANWFEKGISQKTRQLLKANTIKEMTSYYDGVQVLIEEKLFDESIKDTKISTYHLCKDYMLLKNISTPFMPFLSKYGFYRNVAFLCYMNILVVIGLYGYTWEVLVTSILLFMLGVLFEGRSINFWGHMTGVVYRSFIVSKMLDTEASS